LSDVVKKIRGKAGTQVRLKILRKEGEQTRRVEVSLLRAKVNLEDEAASITYIDKTIKGESKKIGIINLPSFYADSRRNGRSSAEDVKKLIKEAKTKNISGLVLDLSTNGGGSLNDAVQLAGLFFKTGNVVKQSSKSKSREEIALADTDPTVDWNGPLVVLTSRISASASEIVSGTLKDYQRAIIVGGDHTFGKGSVQQVVPITGNLGALKVTVGMFYIPGGKSTQHGGVEADVVLPGAFSNDEMGEKSLDYSLPPTTIASFVSKSAYVPEGADRWLPIRTEWIKPLQEKSKKRVEQNKEFQKIIAEVEKAKKRGKLMKVSDILNDKSEKEKIDKQKAKRTMSKDEKTAEYLKRPDIEEASLVLIDLMEIEGTPTVGVTVNSETSEKHN
ncbi:MAG TPA: carboxy terminal-processing peptidase, partial [Pseudobdellovibrionaceae bacterium]|nr:carboxy terminal-processing peptidase [Pseudobdellovibrionaceae bacterium]